MGFVTTSAVIASKAVATPDSSDIWMAAVVALLGSSVLAGLITTAMTNLRASAAVRREGYAKAVRALIARAEYPYRVRRRVSDDPETLSSLVTRGHDIQEQLAACRTWVTSEHRWLGTMYEEALLEIDATVNPCTAEAWDESPIIDASGMNLSGWGPGDPWPHLVKLERAIARRFGWRRIVPAPFWRNLL